MRNIIFLLMISTHAMAFEPICNNPKTVSKKDLKNIIKNETNTRDNQLTVYSVNPPTPIDWSTLGKYIEVF